MTPESHSAHPDYDSRSNTFYSRIRTPAQEVPLPQMGCKSGHVMDCYVEGGMSCSKATSNKRKSSPRPKKNRDARFTVL